MLASLELVRRMAAGRKEDLVTREDSTFGRVARYIDRHYAEDLSIEQLARQFYLSPYHLSHIFRQKTWDTASSSMSCAAGSGRLRCGW